MPADALSCGRSYESHDGFEQASGVAWLAMTIWKNPEMFGNKIVKIPGKIRQS